MLSIVVIIPIINSVHLQKCIICTIWVPFLYIYYTCFLRTVFQWWKTIAIYLWQSSSLQSLICSAIIMQNLIRPQTTTGTLGTTNYQQLSWLHSLCKNTMNHWLCHKYKMPKIDVSALWSLMRTLYIGDCTCFWHGWSQWSNNLLLVPDMAITAPQIIGLPKFMRHLGK